MFGPLGESPDGLIESPAILRGQVLLQFGQGALSFHESQVVVSLQTVVAGRQRGCLHTDREDLPDGSPPPPTVPDDRLRKQ